MAHGSTDIQLKLQVEVKDFRARLVQNLFFASPRDQRHLTLLERVRQLKKKLIFQSAVLTGTEA